MCKCRLKRYLNEIEKENSIQNVTDYLQTRQRKALASGQTNSDRRRGSQTHTNIQMLVTNFLSTNCYEILGLDSLLKNILYGISIISQ